MIEKSKLFKWMKILLICGAIISAWRFIYSGYCFDKGKYFADEDYIEAAIRNNLYDMEIDDSEEAIKNFYVKNPTCCSVSRTPIPWKVRVLSGNYVTVELNYKRKNKSLTKRNIFYKQYVQVLECGNSNYQYGETTESLESAL